MNQYQLHISRRNLKRLYEHAEMLLPQEAVALLFGTTTGASVYANRVELMENTSTNFLTSFSVNPEAEYILLIDAEKRGESLVGIFHSHPAPPKPSLTDMKNMRLNPVIWLIASKLTGSWIIKGYVLDADDVAEVVIHVVELDDAVP
ncbi:MAG: M67 family metallopeptidase [Candidatus Thorarchaeota archaeon]|nr:M67 family metallopeptidase [Candidatus Thorarchaeota archaeon]